MQPFNRIFIMKAFPDFNIPGFDMETYNKRFKNGNVIIHAKSKDISYPEHWGCLSIKCAFNGEEHYQSGDCFYSVNKNNYLIFNEGKSYSSYIFSKTQVESFTVNFSSFFEEEILNSMLQSHDHMLDNFQHHSHRKVEFIEKLHQHDEVVSPVLFKLYKLSFVTKPDYNRIDETYNELLEKLLLLQQHVSKEIQKVKAIKTSTKRELYKRLYQAKDYIDSCYTSPITLNKLSNIACLNNAYFLREFKKFFHLTPYQYVIQKRLELAKELLQNQDASITEICFAIGYEDVSSFTKLFKSHFRLSPETYSHSIKKSIFTC
jgi:AraC family transcriptional regulator